MYVVLICLLFFFVRQCFSLYENVRSLNFLLIFVAFIFFKDVDFCEYVME